MHLVDEQHKRILIVEDEGLIAADVQQQLERLGYPVPVIAQSGEEALRCARSTPFDLVLMDIRLKGAMDGIATAQALKTEFETPVVYMTAHADQETIDRATFTEPLGYILKPVTDGDLRSVVQIPLYRHQMERALRTSEARLFSTLRSLGEGISDLVGRLPGLAYGVGLRPVTSDATLTPNALVGSVPGMAPLGVDAAPTSQRKRGRPCKCAERGITCNHRPAQKLNRVIQFMSSCP